LWTAGSLFRGRAKVDSSAVEGFSCVYFACIRGLSVLSSFLRRGAFQAFTPPENVWMKYRRAKPKAITAGSM
jgi:hypothetical protein